MPYCNSYRIGRTRFYLPSFQDHNWIIVLSEVNQLLFLKCMSLIHSWAYMYLMSFNLLYSSNLWQWKVLQGASWILLTWPSWFFYHFLLTSCQDVPNSWIFPAADLKLAIYPRNPGFAQWDMSLESQIWVLEMLTAIRLIFVSKSF